MRDAEAPGAQGESGHAGFTLPPSLIVLGGALTAGLCLLLLFGPFYEAHAAPADHLQMWLLVLLDGRGPFALQQLLFHRFPLLMILLFGTVLILVPWCRATLLRRERRGAAQAMHRPVGAAAETASRRTRPEHPAVPLAGGEGPVRHSVAELGEMARAAGVRWRPDYATEGGARGLLEILEALEAGPAPEPVLPPETAQPATVPGDHVDEGPRGAEEPSRTDEDLSGGYEIGATSWTPSSIGSVYTSTTLYGAGADGDETDDSDEPDAPEATERSGR